MHTWHARGVLRMLCTWVRRQFASRAPCCRNLITNRSSRLLRHQAAGQRLGSSLLPAATGLCVHLVRHPVELPLHRTQIDHRSGGLRRRHVPFLDVALALQRLIATACARHGAPLGLEPLRT